MARMARAAIRKGAVRVPTLDTPPSRSPFEKSRALEQRYGRTLRSVAAHIGTLVTAFPDPIEDSQSESDILEALARYAALLVPWARAVAARVVNEANKKDIAAWRAHSNQISAGLRAEIHTAPTGTVLRESMARQVGLITSLPTEAATRVHKLAIEARINGTRSTEIAKMIQASGDVSKARATMIARTEVARTGAELTQARAMAAGMTSYVWRTAKDPEVRKDHRLLEGNIYQFANPPIADQRTGARANPGCIYNCRCFAVPLLPS
jgi:SPP1 gp7 family putative phage head morphogenesis protein